MVDFRNVILVLTSNLGSQFLTDPLTSPEEKRNEVMSVVQGLFKPEFLNRLDDIIIFEALSTAGGRVRSSRSGASPSA